jgi:hypothetical protein
MDRTLNSRDREARGVLYLWAEKGFYRAEGGEGWAVATILGEKYDLFKIWDRSFR